MAARKIAGAWVVLLDETDQGIGTMDYAAGETFKMDVSGSELAGLVLTISATPSGDPLDEYEPASVDFNGVAKFRIPDADIGEWIEEGGTAYVNIWTGTVNDDRRRAFATVKRKASIRRLTEAPSPPAWLMASGSWSDAGVWDDTATWTEAA